MCTIEHTGKKPLWKMEHTGEKPICTMEHTIDTPLCKIEHIGENPMCTMEHTGKKTLKRSSWKRRELSFYVLIFLIYSIKVYLIWT